MPLATVLLYRPSLFLVSMIITCAVWRVRHYVPLYFIFRSARQVVREYTGDMQLSKQEVEGSQASYPFI